MALAKYSEQRAAVQRPSAVSIFEALPDAEKRKWEIERRIIRGGIHKAKSMPRRKREALMYFTNLWFHHRNGDGFIHPGAKKVAEKMECSVRTINGVMGELRDEGFLIPLAYAKGGRNATRYAVDLAAILDKLCPKQRFMEAEFEEIRQRSRAHINRAKSIFNRAETAHGNSKAQPSEKPIREVFGDPSDWMEVPF